MATVNIIVENDADFYQAFQYTTASGVPIDLTGAALEMMLRRHAEDKAAVLRLGTDTGELQIYDPVNGLFTVLIVQDTLVHLGLGDYDHSNIMTRVGRKTKIWSGTLTNNAGASR
ncbi:hypothetical protein HAP48_0034930 [Bradyrhizobium septentrionale]|uniref:Uncharacterized protein n=1 Tax=Bradyrhizobium septentrionale TaxID=1404411 RepID=A0A973W0K6_9BRAD|nr:hypothetical protein [Bradyrhizobium septentrionale]UGY13728.1 hypothetical protein HAP48_0034930 [Bradyrhizobium septentrionale]